MTERTETTHTETAVKDDDAVVETETIPGNQMVVDDDIVLQGAPTTRTVERKTEQPRVETETETSTKTVER